MANPLTDTDPEIQVPSSENVPDTVSQIAVQSYGITHRGLVRLTNQDQFLIATLTKMLRTEQSSLPAARAKFGDAQGHIFLVADGMGGSGGGEDASALTVLSIEQFLLNSFKWFFHSHGSEQSKVVEEFRAALSIADARLFAEAATNRELTGMGTTLTMAYHLDHDLFIAHAGDSRCYLFRDGKLTQFTRDHTVADELAHEGMIPADMVKTHPLRHIVTNALGGTYPGVRSEVHKLQLGSHDIIVLCTDGLNSMIDDVQIASVLAADPDPKQACNSLLALALERGGRDNVTVIVARFLPADC